MQFIQNLKTTLPFKVFFYGLVFISVGWTLFYLFLFPKKSAYQVFDTQIEGKIKTYKIDGNLLSVTLKGKELIQLFYTIKQEEEKQFLEETLGYEKTLSAVGVMKKPETNSISNAFSYQKYLSNHHINYVFTAETISLTESASFWAKGKNLLTKFADQSKHSAYIKAFLLGNKEELEIQMLQENGVSHLFAVSGMHISLFVSFLRILFKRFQKIGEVALVLFLWLYAYFVSFSPSVMRAVLFFTLVTFNKKLKANYSSLQLLIICFFLLLLKDPFLLFDIGFQYSFAISFALLWITIPKKGYFFSLFYVSLISFLVSLPISAIHFYQANFLSIFFNILLVPFVSILLYPLTLCTCFFPFLNPILTIVISFFEWVNEVFFQWKWGILILPKCGFCWWILYGVLLYGVFGLKRKSFCVLILCFFIGISSFPKFDSHAYIDILDVGQGDSLLFISPYQKKVVLLDTGGVFSYSKESWQIRKKKKYKITNTISYLKSRGISKIDFLVLSHGDYDHMGEAINLVNHFQVENVVFNCGPYNALEKDLIKVLDTMNIPYYSCLKELNIDKYTFQFLNTKTYANENDNSNVIYLNYENYKFLFMGDAGVEKENDILEKYNLGHIDFLKVGHHGSKTSSSKKFINNIKPKYSLISVGKNNRYGHPNEEVLEALSNSKIYRTDQNGSIDIKLNKNGYKITTCSS